MDDLYLKLISGELPSAKLYEDEFTYAFLDINPINKGHALVVPKVRSRNIFDIDTGTLAHVMATVQKVSCALKEAMRADGVTLVVNNESAGGQEIFHTHVHVIPRFTDDHVFPAPSHNPYTTDEERFALAKVIAQKI